MILRHLSISELNAPVFNLANAFADEDIEEKTPRFEVGDEKAARFVIGGAAAGGTGLGSGDGDLLEFQISSESEGEQGAPSMWMGLSSPGKSSLARRRLLSRGSSDDDDGSSLKPKSPPKSPSARF